MGLYTYRQLTQILLSDLKQEVVNPANIDTFINVSRRQIAGQGECIRVQGSIATVISQRNYNFTSIGLGGASIAGVINVRSMLYSIGTGQKWVTPRPWPWFELYFLNNANPSSDVPSTWSQYGQGATGSFYLDPLPADVYSLSLDCVTYPADLTDDASVETIPYPWTDAVPYYAAYMAYLNAQQTQRADAMMSLFTTFMTRARQLSNPDVNRYMYSQAADPVRLPKLGLVPKAAKDGG